MVFGVELSICMPPPANVSVTLTLDPMTLKTFPAMPTHLINIYAKFRSNPSTEFRDIASRGTSVNRQRTDTKRPDGRTDDPKTLCPPLVL